MKAALIALALLMTSSSADAYTIVIDENPIVLQQTYPQLYELLLYGGRYGSFPGCTTCIQGANGWSDDIWIFVRSNPELFPPPPPGEIIFIDIEWSSAVPEPATWALLLFGFAFFAIKGIWPRGIA